MIVPNVQHKVQNTGYCKFNQNWLIQDCAVGFYLQNLFRNYVDILLKCTQEHAQIRFEECAEVPSEGYKLEVESDAITIFANNPSGHFYGATTLAQLIMGSDHPGEIPCQTIVDEPKLRWRGLLLDSARHFQSVDRVKWILDLMALHRMNVLHWHLTEDQAWRVEIKRYPQLHQINDLRSNDEPQGRGFYSQDDIRDIVDYASERFITIVPEIEVPAHCTAAMAAFPELTCTEEPVEPIGEGIQTFLAANGRRIFCAAKEKSFEFIENVLDEIVDLFPSEVIHIGGDERPDGIWSACPNCAELMKQNGIESESALQHFFMDRVAAQVRKRGRRSMAWTPTLQHGLPEGQIAQDWFYDLIPQAVEMGFDVVNSKDRFTYLDYPNYPGRQKPGWMPDLSVERMLEFQPVPTEVPEALRHKVLGAECSLWSEFIEDDDLSIALFPRLCAFADVAWGHVNRHNWQPNKRLLERFGVNPATPTLEASPKLAYVGHVESSMATATGYEAEFAFDNKFVRCFWSEGIPKKGDHLTLYLDQPVVATRIAVFTGSDFAYDDVAKEYAIELSEDGTLFEIAATSSDRYCTQEFTEKQIKAIRLVLMQDNESQLAVRMIKLS